MDCYIIYHSCTMRNGMEHREPSSFCYTQSSRIFCYLHPVLGVLQHFCEPTLRAPRGGHMLVFPPGIQRERHQDALISGSGCVQSELCSSIIYQVKLCIMATPEQLPLPLLVTTSWR